MLFVLLWGRWRYCGAPSRTFLAALDEHGQCDDNGTWYLGGARFALRCPN